MQIKPIVIVLGLLVMLPTALLGNNGSANPAKDQPEVSVQLRLTTQLLTPMSAGVFEVILTNATDHPVWIYNNLNYGTEIWIKEETGGDLPHETVGALCPPPPPRPKDFTCLQPGELRKYVDDRSLNDLGVKRRGKFWAKASYYYRVDFLHEEEVLRLMDPPAQSPSVCIVVQ